MKLNQILGMTMLEPFRPGPLHNEWNKFTIPQALPLPEPYETEEKTWHYNEI